MTEGFGATPLRIGFINENLSGHAAYHHQLLAALANYPSLTCDVFDLPSRGLLRRALTSPLPLRAGWDWDAPLFRNQVGQSLSAWPRLKTMVAANDVMHMYSQNAAPLALRYLRARPLVVSSDATCLQASEKFPFRYPGRGSALGLALSGAVERRLLAYASAVIAQSDWARNGFIRDAGVPGERVHVVRVGAPLALPPIIRTPNDRVRIVFVGASMGRKGGWALLDVLSDLLDTSVELHLVTREHVAARPGVIVHNDLRPNDGKIQGILALADIFALPTDMDMSPNAVLEAMASGLPVVAYRTGALPEMVEDGGSGYLAPVLDTRALKAALQTLISSPQKRQSFGARSRQILIERFDQSEAARLFAKIIIDVAHSGRQKHGGTYP